MPATRKQTKSVRFDDIHLRILEGLTPFYGSTSAEVIRNIVLLWLHENIGGETIDELKRMGAIRLEVRKREDEKQKH